jgi:hypothetical protein
MTDESQQSTEHYVPRYEAAFSAQLVAIFFGGSTCAFCRQPAFKAAIPRLPLLLRAQAAAANYKFHWVGVAAEWDVRKGLDYLQSFGEFDEISAGGSWWNTAVAERLFGDEPPVVPTILLLTRTFAIDAARRTLIVGPETPLTSFRGSRSIEDWISEGAPVNLPPP